MATKTQPIAQQMLIEQADKNYLDTFVHRLWRSDSRLDNALAVASILCVFGLAWMGYCALTNVTYDELCEEYAKKRFEVLKKCESGACEYHLALVYGLSADLCELRGRVTDLTASMPDGTRKAIKNAAVAKFEKALLAKQLAESSESSKDNPYPDAYAASQVPVQEQQARAAVKPSVDQFKQSLEQQ